MAFLGVITPTEESAWLKAADARRHPIRGSHPLGRAGANTEVVVLSTTNFVVLTRGVVVLSATNFVCPPAVH